LGARDDKSLKGIKKIYYKAKVYETSMYAFYSIFLDAY